MGYIMKKNVYIIYEKDIGPTNIAFTSKKSAELFLYLMDKKQIDCCYATRQYDENHINYMKKMKHVILVRYCGAVKLTLNGTLNYKLRFKNGIYETNYLHIKEMAEKQKLDFDKWYQTKWDKDPLYCVESDIDVVVKKYEEINKKLEMYKAVIKVMTLKNKKDLNLEIKDINITMKT